MIDKSTIQRVRDRIDIEDILSWYNVQFTRRGKKLSACCPFHSESNPSFNADKDLGLYNCFSCGAGGDAIKFVMEMENLPFVQAIEFIANKYGIQVLHHEKPLTEEEKQEKEVRELLFRANAKVQEFFLIKMNEHTPEAAKAREYAFNRWGEDYCRMLGIGFAPDSWNELIDYCKKEFIDAETLEKAGIVKKREKNSGYYSLFRNRVMIPIKDETNRIIAFTGRDISDNEGAVKYLNSSDSPIFKKSTVVFGLNTASRQACISQRFIIVEGAPDVMKLQSQAVGLTETVGSLGTAWSDEQFDKLQRRASNLVFLPDADPPKNGKIYGPGIEAVLKNGLKAHQKGFKVSVKEIPYNRTQIEVPLFDYEIDELIERQLKVKNKGVKPKMRFTELSKRELENIPRTRFIPGPICKNDPDSYINSISDFNTLQNESFVVWYGIKELNRVESDDEKLEVQKKICEDLLLPVKDDVLRNHYLVNLAKEFGTVKSWHAALLAVKIAMKRNTAKKEREAMTQDQIAMHDLGFFIKDGGYASYNKDGDIERWSNFIMKPMFHIIDGENAIRIFKLINERGTQKEIEFRQDELISLSRFQQRVESLGFFNFKGDTLKLQNLKEYLYSITDSATQLSKMGLNEAEQVYVFGDGVFANNKLYEVNELGTVKIGDKTYYLPAFSKMHIDKKDAYQFERAFSCRTHGDISLHDFVDKMVTVFGNNAKVGFAFVLATLFLDVVKQSSKRLALLNIFGRKGTGKTELGTALMSFFIRQNDPPSLATTSMASLNEMLSNAENNLVHLDEYKNELDFRKIEILKQIWGGSGQTKKNMDGDKKVQRTFVRSGVILTGQDAPTRDDALFSRVIHLQYSEVTFSKEAKRNFEEFQTISARGVSHLTVELLKLRKVFEADYASHYAICKRELISALSEDQIEDRLLNNWLAPLAAFHTAQTSIDVPYSYRELFDLCVQGIRAQNEKLKRTSDIAVFWNMLDSNHMQGKIVSKAHFIIRKQPFFKRKDQTLDFGRDKLLLYLNFQNVVTTLGQRVNGTNIIGKLDPVSLESYLRTHPAFLGTKQQRFQVLTANGTLDYTTEMIDNRPVRKNKEVRPMAFVFDYELLQESYELNLETIERSENEISEDELEIINEKKALTARETEKNAEPELPF